MTKADEIAKQVSANGPSACALYESTYGRYNPRQVPDGDPKPAMSTVKPFGALRSA
jgi:hypothetical protein